MKTFGTMQSQALNMPAPKDTLNPKLFLENEQVLRPDIHDLLIEGAEEFVSRLGISPEMIDDIRIVGGNASYNYHDASDIDATIMLNREMELTKEDVRALQVAANHLTYRFRPIMEGIDLNFYISTRNVGGLRPAKQSIYSLSQQDFMAGPTKYSEVSANYLAGKANFFLELIEECVSDDSNDADTCAEDLLKRLKKFRVKGLKGKDGEESTENLIYKMLVHSGYVRVLRDKTDELEKNFVRVRNPQPIIHNEEYRMLVREGAGIDTVPHSIIKWNKRILTGANPTELIKRIRPILDVFNENAI